MTWALTLLVLLFGWTAHMTQPGAKQLFYDAGRSGASLAPNASGLRHIIIAPHQVNGGGRLPVGMHFWLETESGAPISQSASRSIPGKYTLHVRHNNEVPAVLSIWQVDGQGRELTPRTDERFGGYRVARQFRVPGTFALAAGDEAAHIIIVLARSQTEVPRDPANARERLIEIPRYFSNITETDESTPGEIGTYVVSRTGGPTAAEVVLRTVR